MDKKTSFWISYLVVVICALFVIEIWAPIDYIYKILLKISLMLLPLFWVAPSLFAKPDIGRLKIALALGIGSILFIQVAYYLLRDFIDLEQIRVLLEERQGITVQIYLWVVIYATFGNSILEEIFFRGFMVQSGVAHPWIFSSALFSFYHLTIFIGWFSWWVTAIALIVLFAGGLIFCWLNGPRKSIWNSWLMHIFADISIFAIGFKLYY